MTPIKHAKCLILLALSAVKVTSLFATSVSTRTFTDFMSAQDVRHPVQKMIVVDTFCVTAALKS